ncbi:MAG: ABC transporter substrate-binding protein [Candidatus Heimdallarchaeota archaeon]|nr:MAG: ABC transporter substrate-binding protein [Candidatus Heimdallarchaeota archaeon]
MRWDKNIIKISLFLLIFSLSFFTSNKQNIIDGKGSESFQIDNILTIVTTLDTTTTTAFKTHFLETPQAVNLGITDIDFRQATTEDGWKKLLQDPSKSVDLAWGFQTDYFHNLEEWNLLKPITNSTLLDYINENIPDGICGLETKHYNDSELVWFGTAFRTYGYTVNHDFLDTYGFPVPITWEELASPIYYINSDVNSIGMSDPPLSTTNTRIYQTVLQAYGWEVGWSILTRMGANAGIYPGSVSTRAAVVSGEVGIAMTTSSYGFIAMRENTDTEFIIPEGYAVIDFCDISLGINCDNQEDAEAFLQFVVSPEGQAIWLTEGIDQFPLNEPAFNTTLGQTRTDIYELLMSSYGTFFLYFNYSLAQSTLEETVYYFHDTIVVEHTLLQETWGIMVQMLRNSTINSTYFVELVYRLGALPENLECYDYDIYYGFPCPSWSNFAKEKYQTIIDELTRLNEPQETSTSIEVTILLLLTISVVLNLRNKKKR